MRLLLIFMFGVVISLIQGCASTASGKNQSVSVVTVYDGEQINEASCTLTNDSGTWYVKTPGSAFIRK
jgi:hypothetical protein